MFERFTDRARKVMALANQEAQRFNHEYIGTEHILLGLVREGSGVGASVLKNLEVDLREVRLEVEKLVKSGPETVSTDRRPQTPRAKEVINHAVEEARGLHHNYVGTEHLLLGLLREQEGVAAHVLLNLNLNLENVREEVLNLLGANVDRPVAPRSAKKVPGGVPAAVPFAWHPLVLDFTRLIGHLQSLKDQAIIRADYEQAAELRDRAETLQKTLAKLCQRLQKDPSLGLYRPAALVRLCSEPALPPPVCLQLRPVRLATDQTLQGAFTLIVGAPGSGRRTMLQFVAWTLFERTAGDHAKPWRLVTPLPGPTPANPDGAAAVAAIVQDLLGTEDYVLAMIDLHRFLDASADPAAPQDAWRAGLAELRAARRPVVATTTPDGLARLKTAWPDLLADAPEIPLPAPAGKQLVEAVDERLRETAAQLHVEPGFAGEVVRAATAWPNGRDLAEPQRSMELLRQVLAYDHRLHATESEKAADDLHQTQLAALAEKAQRQIASNLMSLAQDTLRTIAELQRLHAARIAENPRRLPRQRIAEFLQS